MVHISHTNPLDEMVPCSGVLIKERYILTCCHGLAGYGNRFRTYSSYVNHGLHAEAQDRKANLDLGLLRVVGEHDGDYAILRDDELFVGKELYLISNSLRFGYGTSSSQVCYMGPCGDSNNNLCASSDTLVFMTNDSSVGAGASEAPFFYSRGRIAEIVRLRTHLKN